MLPDAVTANDRTYWLSLAFSSEQRCAQNWIQTMASYVRSLDPFHLISIGSEGFYGKANAARSNYANPQGTDTYAACVDQMAEDMINTKIFKERIRAGWSPDIVGGSKC